MMSFRLLSSKIVLPVIEELPIILVFFFIIKANLMEFFQDNDYDTVWDYVSVFSIWFLYSYFIAATISISKRNQYLCLGIKQKKRQNFWTSP